MICFFCIYHFTTQNQFSLESYSLENNIGLFAFYKCWILFTLNKIIGCTLLRFFASLICTQSVKGLCFSDASAKLSWQTCLFLLFLPILCALWRSNIVNNVKCACVSFLSDVLWAHKNFRLKKKMIMTRRRIFHITCFAACCWKAGRQSGFLVSF